MRGDSDHQADKGILTMPYCQDPVKKEPDKLCSKRIVLKLYQSVTRTQLMCYC